MSSIGGHGTFTRAAIAEGLASGIASTIPKRRACGSCCAWMGGLALGFVNNTMLWIYVFCTLNVILNCSWPSLVLSVALWGYATLHDPMLDPASMRRFWQIFILCLQVLVVLRTLDCFGQSLNILVAEDQHLDSAARTGAGAVFSTLHRILEAPADKNFQLGFIDFKLDVPLPSPGDPSGAGSSSSSSSSSGGSGNAGGGPQGGGSAKYGSATFLEGLLPWRYTWFDLALMLAVLRHRRFLRRSGLWELSRRTKYVYPGGERNGESSLARHGV